MWTNLRARAAVGCGETDRGVAREEIVVGNACGGNGRKAWKQGDTAESHVGGGAITIASLSPHANISNWTIERLAHQMPDAPVNREGPWAREPSKCLNGQSYGERLAKETF